MITEEVKDLSNNLFYHFGRLKQKKAFYDYKCLILTLIRFDLRLKCYDCTSFIKKDL